MYFESNERPLPGWARYVAMAANEHVYAFSARPSTRVIDGQTIWSNASNPAADRYALVMDVTHILTPQELTMFRARLPSETLQLVCGYDDDMKTVIEQAGQPTVKGPKCGL